MVFLPQFGDHVALCRASGQGRGTDFRELAGVWIYQPMVSCSILFWIITDLCIHTARKLDSTLASCADSPYSGLNHRGAFFRAPCALLKKARRGGAMSAPPPIRFNPR